MAKLGWYVSTFTGLTRVDTKRQAFGVQDALLATGKDPGVILRECDCGCGQPASKALPGSREAAIARLRPLLICQGEGNYPAGWYRQPHEGGFGCEHGEAGHVIHKDALAYVNRKGHVYCQQHAALHSDVVKRADGTWGVRP